MMALFVYFYPLGNCFWSTMLTCLLSILYIKYWLLKNQFIESLKFTNKRKRLIETCFRTLSLLKSTCNLIGFCKTLDRLSSDIQNKANYKSDKNYSLPHVLPSTPFTCGHMRFKIDVSFSGFVVCCSPFLLPIFCPPWVILYFLHLPGCLCCINCIQLPGSLRQYI